MYPEVVAGTSADMSTLQASVTGDLDGSANNSGGHLLLPTSDSEVAPVSRLVSEVSLFLYTYMVFDWEKRLVF